MFEGLCICKGKDAAGRCLSSKSCILIKINIFSFAFVKFL